MTTPSIEERTNTNKVGAPPREIPPAHNTEYWKPRTEALLNFLGKWRTWDELGAWAKQAKFDDADLRNALAWLRLQNLAAPSGGLWGSTRLPKQDLAPPKKLPRKAKPSKR